jgi:hypothetical protein
VYGEEDMPQGYHMLKTGDAIIRVQDGNSKYVFVKKPSELDDDWTIGTIIWSARKSSFRVEYAKLVSEEEGFRSKHYELQQEGGNLSALEEANIADWDQESEKLTLLSLDELTPNESRLIHGPSDYAVPSEKYTEYMGSLVKVASEFAEIDMDLFHEVFRKSRDMDFEAFVEHVVHLYTWEEGYADLDLSQELGRREWWIEGEEAEKVRITDFGLLKNVKNGEIMFGWGDLYIRYDGFRGDKDYLAIRGYGDRATWFRVLDDESEYDTKYFDIVTVTEGWQSLAEFEDNFPSSIYITETLATALSSQYKMEFVRENKIYEDTYADLGSRISGTVDRDLFDQVFDDVEEQDLDVRDIREAVCRLYIWRDEYVHLETWEERAGRFQRTCDAREQLGRITDFGDLKNAEYLSYVDVDSGGFYLIIKYDVPLGDPDFLTIMHVPGDKTRCKVLDEYTYGSNWKSMEDLQESDVPRFFVPDSLKGELAAQFNIEITM